MRVLVVVKADAYGHGAVPAARTFVREGADFLGVGDSHEALELRRAGIRVPILILGAIIEGEIDNVVRHDIRPCIHSTERMLDLERTAARLDKTVRVHLMVDTGMGRLGVNTENVLDLARGIRACPHLELDGICTHLSSVYGQAPEDRAYTDEQYRRFLDAVEGLHGFLKCRPGAVYGSHGPFNMVRPGNVLYGLNPDEALQTKLGIEPVLSLRSQVVFFKDLPAGTPVSYGRTFVTERKTRVATLPVGYNDGFRYHLSNQAQVLIRGRSAPVIGKVTMDYTMVDVTDIPGVELGEVATLVGSDGEAAISMHDLARKLDTIPLELSCGIGRRVRRIFRGGASETLPDADPDADARPGITPEDAQRRTPVPRDPDGLGDAALEGRDAPREDGVPATT